MSARLRTAVAGLALALCCAGAWAAVRSGPPPAGDRLLGPTGPTQPVEALLVLRLRRQALAAYLRRLYDPRSPGFERYGDAASFGARFGLSDRRLARLERTLRRRGWRILRGYPQRTALRIRGTAALVRGTFGVELRDYRQPDGVVYRRPNGPARVPPSLAPFVTGVADLGTKPLPQPADVPDRTPGGVLGAAALAPGDAALAYDVAPLHAAGIDGQGQRVAVVSFDGFDDGDVADFARRFGIVGPAPRHVPVDGGANANDHTEGNLDVEVVRAVAPAAQVESYEAPQDASLADVFNAIFAGDATIVTSSWGICETLVEDDYPGDRAATEQALQVAAFKGVTVFAASGDSGAYDCQRADFSARTPTVDFPSDSPWVVSVGGTVLSVRRDGTYLDEAGWQDPLSDGGGGGGVNPVEPRPPWQRGIAGNLPAGRVLPDVSAAAGIGSPWATDVDGRLVPVAGTSAATPFWAAAMALVQQDLERSGAGPLCFAAPLLYDLAARSWPHPPFHDVTRGGNRYYAAGPGWDAATGLGSPDVANLAGDLVSWRKAHPLRSGGNACAQQVRP